MRTVLIPTLGAVLIAGIALEPYALAAAPKSEQPKEPPEILARRALAQQFGEALKQALEQAIQNGGPANGISVCHDKAGTIATEFSQDKGVLIGRTSLKIRNPDNAPDNWELAVLKQFEARKEQGEATGSLEYATLFEDDQGKKTFRYMKAIPTAALCVKCHGETIDPEVEAKLKALYPNDQARGFKEGDLRGAFTLSTPVP